MALNDATLAALEQRVKTLDEQMSDVGSLPKEVAVLSERMSAVIREQSEIRRTLAKQAEESDRREKGAADERRLARREFRALAVTLLGALIGSATVILSSVPH